MRTRLHMFVRICVMLALLPALVLSELCPTTAGARADSAAPAMSDASAALIFIENAGHLPDGARFQVRGRDLTVWLAEDAIWLTAVDQTPHPSAASDSTLRGGANIKLSFAGANPHPRLEPFDRLATHISFFVGSDPAEWQTDVPAWGGVRYANLYPGIDLELTGENGQLVPRLTARPDADLSAVQLRVEGANAVAVEADGLRLSTAAGSMTWPLLQAEHPVAEAVVRSVGAGMFEVTAPFAPPDSSQPSPTDPATALLYGTFLGGSSEDEGYGIALDGNGATYVTGYTVSSGFPTTPGAFDTSYNGTGDLFVAKLNAAGTALEYATFLGGGSEDAGWVGWNIAVDGSGAAYVAGHTKSSDFPTTAGAFDTDFNGIADGFVVKLNPTGTALEYSTFLGGSGTDGCVGIALDGSGAAYIAGYTWSSGFPTTPGAFDTSYNDAGDLFVTKLNATGSALDYSTFLGGGDVEEGRRIVAADSGEAYVTGRTESSNFPTTVGAFDTSYNGGEWGDVFVVKLNTAGSALEYGTFLGGTDSDEGYHIAVDEGGAAYITGYTSSSGFPTTPGAFDTSFNGIGDAFVAKLNAAGSALDYATFLGGSGDDWGRGIAVDGSGAAYVTGGTQSSDMPTTRGAFDLILDSDDAFVARLGAAGSVLEYATFLGGSGYDEGMGIAVDGSGAAWIVGFTGSPDLATTPGAFDTSYNGGETDAFVVRLEIKIIFSVYLPVVVRNY